MTVTTVEHPTGTDITVNLDGLWLLQALLGIQRLAPELRGRPYGEPRRAEQDWLTSHPGLSVLIEQGIADADGVVRPDIAERMAVLAAPDVEVVVLVSHGRMDWGQAALDDPSTWRAVPDGQLRIVLARRDRRWASAVRADEQIAIDDFSGGGDADRLARLVCDGLDSISMVAPAQFSAVNVPLDEMKDAAAQRLQAGEASRRDAPLRAIGLRGAALAAVRSALDEPTGEAVLYARAYVDTTAVPSESVLDVRDTEAGRLAMYRLNPPRGSRQEAMAIMPAAPAQVCHGVSTVLASVAVRSWETHRSNW
jgi:EspG family